MKIKYIRTIIFFLAIILIPSFTLFGEKETVSYNENKTLASAPQFSISAWKSRRFMSATADFLSDHFVLRENFIKLKNSVDKLIGKNEINGVFELDGKLIQTFRDVDYKLTDKNLAAVNTLKTKSGNAKVFFMPVVTAQEKYANSLPQYLNVSSESEYVDYCKSKLSGVTLIDASNAVMKTDYAFYATDHHWTTDCAYEAYVSAAEYLGFEAKTADYFDIVDVSNSFKGTLYSSTLNESIPSDTIRAYKSKTNITFSVKDKKYDSLYFESFLEEKDKYAYFLGGNYGVCEIVNNDINYGEELLVIKDSYANCFLPFLAEHYSKITVIDPRYCNHTEIKNINVSQYDDILILFNVLGFAEEQNFSIINFTEGC